MNPKLSNLLPVFLLVAEIGNVADFMGRNKGASKYLKIVDLFDELTAIGSVDFKQVLNDFKGLENSDRSELVEKITAKIDLGDAKVESLIEEGLGIAVDLASIVERSITLVKTFKPAASLEAPASLPSIANEQVLA